MRNVRDLDGIAMPVWLFHQLKGRAAVTGNDDAKARVSARCHVGLELPYCSFEGGTGHASTFAFHEDIGVVLCALGGRGLGSKDSQVCALVLA